MQQSRIIFLISFLVKKLLKNRKIKFCTIFSSLSLSNVNQPCYARAIVDTIQM